MEDDLANVLGGLNADVAGLAQELSALRTKLTAGTPEAAARAAHAGVPKLSLAPKISPARGGFMARTNTQLATALRRALEVAGAR